MRIELPAVTLPKNLVAHGSGVGEFKEGVFSILEVFRNVCMFIYQGHLQTAAGCGDRFADAIQSTWYAATGRERLGASAWSCACLGGFTVVGISVLGGV